MADQQMSLIEELVSNQELVEAISEANLPGCAVCEKRPSATCPHAYCGFRDFCRDRDNRREVARIMGLSDAEIAAEVTRDGETPESVAAKCRAIFERACAIVDGRPASTVTSQNGATHD